MAVVLDRPFVWRQQGQKAAGRRWPAGCWAMATSPADRNHARATTRTTGRPCPCALLCRWSAAVASAALHPAGGSP